MRVKSNRNQSKQRLMLLVHAYIYCYDAHLRPDLDLAMDPAEMKDNHLTFQAYHQMDKLRLKTNEIVAIASRMEDD